MIKLWIAVIVLAVFGLIWIALPLAVYGIYAEKQRT
jgi:hypothetical protein